MKSFTVLTGRLGLCVLLSSLAVACDDGASEPAVEDTMLSPDADVALDTVEDTAVEQDTGTVQDTASPNPALQCRDVTTFALTQYTFEHAQAFWSLPEQYGQSDTAGTGEVEVGRLSAVIENGTMTVSLGEPEPSSSFVVVVRPEADEALPGPLSIGHKDFVDSAAPASASYMWFSELTDANPGGPSYHSGVYMSTGGTLVLHTCPVEVGDKAVGEFDIVYDDGDEQARTTGWFDVVVLESDGSLPCGGPGVDVCE